MSARADFMRTKSGQERYPGATAGSLARGCRTHRATLGPLGTPLPLSHQPPSPWGESLDPLPRGPSAL